MAGGVANMDQFESYFKRTDLDQDGCVSGTEVVSFFQASGLPKPVLAQTGPLLNDQRFIFSELHRRDKIEPEAKDGSDYDAAEEQLHDAGDEDFSRDEGEEDDYDDDDPSEDPGLCFSLSFPSFS